MRPWNDLEALKFIAGQLGGVYPAGNDTQAAIRAIHATIDLRSKCLNCGELLTDRTHSPLGRCLYAATRYHSEALAILWEAYQRCDITYAHLMRWDAYTPGVTCAGTELP